MIFWRSRTLWKFFFRIWCLDKTPTIINVNNKEEKTVTNFEEYKTKLIEKMPDPDPDGDGHTEE